MGVVGAPALQLDAEVEEEGKEEKKEDATMQLMLQLPSAIGKSDGEEEDLPCYASTDVGGSDPVMPAHQSDTEAEEVGNEEGDGKGKEDGEEDAAVQLMLQQPSVTRKSETEEDKEEKEGGSGG